MCRMIYFQMTRHFYPVSIMHSPKDFFRFSLPLFSYLIMMKTQISNVAEKFPLDGNEM